MMLINAAYWKKTKNYIAFGCIAIATIGLIGYFVPSVRVGDGSEYYALFFAFKSTGTPWLTALAYEQYSQLVSAGQIINLVPAEKLSKLFPILRVGETSDFNHFWFYSFLSFIFYKIFILIGFQLSAQQSFLIAHCALLFLTFSIGFYFYRWKGFFSVFLLVFSSPIIWYLDKVHIEFFTFSLCLSAVISINARRYLIGSFLLAIASTQNPSFAAIAFVPLVFRVFIEKESKYSFLELLMFIGTVFFVLIHPVYYLMRYSVITPQLIAGGAVPGIGLSKFYVWFIDFDIGLFPNWITGIVLILFFVFLTKKEDKKINISYFLFVLIYIIVSIYANSSTTNFNSGATPGIARYATWYLPLFFPLVLLVLNAKKYLFLILVLALTIINLYSNNPRLLESYSSPSKLSLNVQKYLPFLYFPPAEIFSERYSMLGDELEQTRVLGVVGPDCKKVLLYPGLGRSYVYAPIQCNYNIGSMIKLFGSMSMKGNSPFYGIISDGDIAGLKVKYDPGHHQVGVNQPGNWILGKGWSNPEDWGVWSESSHVRLSLPCNSQAFYYKKDYVNLKIYIAPFIPQNIDIITGNKLLHSRFIDKAETINLKIPINGCVQDLVNVDISISRPISPYDLGQSSDKRKLGISLTKFDLYE